MNAILHVVDAFTAKPFTGNPAGVCILSGPADAAWMRLVASEMNLSETAFLHSVGNGFSLRWFTPAVEVDLCGHATLASAFTLWNTGVLPPEEEARFQTRSGLLTCRLAGDWVEMDFPATPAERCITPAGLSDALGAEPAWTGRSAFDLLVELCDARQVRDLSPNYTALAGLPARGIIVTCRSDSADFDFISRFFAPAVGVNEDPVTGSAHCTLGPYWQSKLRKDDFTAYQASARGGVLKVSVRNNRVLLRGQAVMMSRVEMLATRAPGDESTRSL